MDSKAKVKIGNLSRGGKGRTLKPKEVDDHDHKWQTTLVPFGILNTQSDQLSMGANTKSQDRISIEFSSRNGRNRRRFKSYKRI